MGELFNQLYDEYFNKIYKLCFYKTGDKDEAEDLTQEIFIKVYKGLKKFKSESSPYTWIYTIAVRTCIDYKVKKSKNKIDLGIELNIKDNCIIEDEHVKKDRNFLIKYKINKLDEKYRMVLYLYYYEDTKIKDIAIILKESENTIKTWLRRGKEKLKKDLDKEGIGYE